MYCLLWAMFAGGWWLVWLVPALACGAIAYGAVRMLGWANRLRIRFLTSAVATTRHSLVASAVVAGGFVYLAGSASVWLLDHRAWLLNYWDWRAAAIAVLVFYGRAATSARWSPYYLSSTATSTWPSTSWPEITRLLVFKGFETEKMDP